MPIFKMINTGIKVLVKGFDEKEGTVLNVKDGFAEVSIDSKKQWFPIDDLTDRSDEQINKIIQGRFDDTLDFILTVDANRLLNEYKFNPYVLASSTKITIFPHQIDEVNWGLENNRIMIADEVGLGKTIIAALIASEQKARGLADRILYVVPKSLVLKWQDELSGKFDTETRILDSEYIKQDNDPFSKDHYDYITSMDFLKREENIRLINDKIDLVVVDEAHKFKIKTARFELGSILSEKSDSMIFLTATPHDGRDEDFIARMSLLDPFVPDISSSTYLWKRHIKENVIDMEGKQVFPDRKSNTVNIELTNQEREINELIDNYIRNRYQDANTSRERNAVRFLSIIFKKRSASSFEALRISLTNRINKLGTVSDENSLQNAQKKMESFDEDNDVDYEDIISDAEGITIGHGDIDKEKRDLEGIIHKIEELKSKDSKFDSLLDWIKKIKTTDPKAKILIFTEYRDTLNYLIERLSKYYSWGKIDGTMPIHERRDALEEFSKTTGSELLLCTDSAGEGIDMQFCNVEFNYDIPWNPNKLEQRMGRIHRIGQTRIVYYYNLITDKENSIDGYILSKLFEKINRIKDAMGDSIFDILGRIINPDMISKMYEELLNIPKSEWEAKITLELEKIIENKNLILQKTKQLLEGHKLDHTVLENIRKIKRNAVDSGEIKRFLEVWSQSNEGKFEEIDKALHTAKIMPPHELALKLGGILEGTFDGKIAQKKGWSYLALGNKKIQKILNHAANHNPVTVLSHPTKSGLICVYKLSIIDGRGRERDAKIIAMFHNEDGKVSEIDPRSLWSYDDGKTQPNTQFLINSKKRIEEKLIEIKNEFHELNVIKLDEIKQKTKNAVEKHTIVKINDCNAKIEVYKTKEKNSPHYAKLITKEENKRHELKKKMDIRKETVDKDFASNVITDLIGIALVIPETDANERKNIELAGMKAVIEYECESAENEEQRSKIHDLSERDTGYDIVSFDKCIEVKSFKTTGEPKITNHEWETARRMQDDYWLYVVEDVFNERKTIQQKITRIQNPHKTLSNIITPIEETTTRYYIKDWNKIKESLDKKTNQ